MHFLSSKLVHQLETAFYKIMDGERIKQGEALLEKLKREPNFDLALATFISRSEDYNKRLFAILELEKKLVISDILIAWSLREVYEKDSYNIGKKICKLITAKENISFAGEFLKMDRQLSGIKTYRQIQVVFNLLKHQDKAEKAIQHHFSLLCDHFVKTFSLLQSDQECFFLELVCLSLFYWHSMRDSSCFINEQLIYQWKDIERKCFQSNIEEVILLASTINGLITNSKILYRPNYFFNFLIKTFRLIYRGEEDKLQFYSKAFEMILKNSQLLNQSEQRQEFIKAMVSLNGDLINKMASNFKIYGQIQVQFGIQAEQENASEKLVRKLCNKLIDSIFSEHYQWFRFQHLPKYKTSNQALVCMLSMVNYSDSISFQRINQLEVPIMAQIYQELSQTRLDFNPKENSPRITRFVTLIQFLIKFKSNIEISALTEVVDIISAQGRVQEVLSPFCDAFLSEIWKELTFLPINELTSFVEYHLEKINSNQWTIRFKSYECFLHIALYLQQSNQYFTSCCTNDSLLHRVLDSHMAICQIMKENSKADLKKTNQNKKMNFELFQMLLELTSFIIENKQLRTSSEIMRALSLQYLVQKIEQHALYSDYNAIIVAFYRYQTNQVIKFLQKQSKNWPIDESDYMFQIQLYLKQIDFASERIASSEAQELLKSLGIKIIQFSKHLPLNELNKFKDTKLWNQLELRYNINAFIDTSMEIECL